MLTENCIALGTTEYPWTDLRGDRGIKPPYLPKTYRYPLSLLFYFLDETIKNKRGGKRREGEEEEWT